MDNLNYGIIGNCRTGALISEDGSIDWLCLPQFDSPSVFAKILDDEKGGHFAIKPVNVENIEQRYIKNTNILSTRFTCKEGIFEVQDFMPRYKTEQLKEHSSTFGVSPNFQLNITQNLNTPTTLPKM
jgi:GH15 family glucan-1,4-alpha-glucosidase